MRIVTNGACRRHALIACSALTALLTALPFVKADEITITTWDLGVHVYGDGMDEDFSVVVQNPYNGSLLAAPSGHASTAASQHEFAWSGGLGTFLTQSQQLAVGASGGSAFTTASDVLHLSVLEPLPLHISGSWTYELPADFMMTQFSVAIGGESSHTSLFRQEYTRTTFPGDPPSDTLLIGGDVVIPPGETWLIQYTMSLEADAGPNFSAVGAGYVNLQISPEGSTLALFFPLLLALPRRRRARA